MASILLGAMCFWVVTHLHIARRKKRSPPVLLSGESQPLLQQASSLQQSPAVGAGEVAGMAARVPIKERLQSLDVFRGFTIALMILVDNTGAAFPPIDHSPWDGIHLADFVMPFFDFMVGVSLAISFAKFDLASREGAKRWPAFKKATVRFVKIFLIGVATQVGVRLLA